MKIYVENVFQKLFEFWKEKIIHSNRNSGLHFLFLFFKGPGSFLQGGPHQGWQGSAFRVHAGGCSQRGRMSSAEKPPPAPGFWNRTHSFQGSQAALVIQEGGGGLCGGQRPLDGAESLGC